MGRAGAAAGAGAGGPRPGYQIDRWLDQRLATLAREREAGWRPDTSGPEAYAASLQPLRERLREHLSLLDPPPAVERPLRAGAAESLGAFRLRSVSVPVWQGVELEALVLRPDDAVPRPTLVAFHGLTGSPEAFVGMLGPSPTRALCEGLLRRGFALVVPRLASGWQDRLRLARKARLLGLEWLGLEALAVTRLLDRLGEPQGVDAARIGLYGFSRGGQLALLSAALDPRPAAVAVASWFTDRTAKLLDNTDPRRPSFLDSPEGEQFVKGLLRDITDVRLAALVAPRPLLITNGLDDPVLPFEDVERSYDAVADLYAALDRAERTRLELHVGGHEPATAATLDFFMRWLTDGQAGGAGDFADADFDLGAAIPRAASRRPRLSQAAASRRLRARRARRR